MPVLRTFVEQTLGPAFDPLYRKSQQARKNGDHTFVAHRLIYLYERLLISEKSWESGQKEVDFLAITELQYLKDMFDQWKKTDVWGEIGPELRQREAYVHCAVLLGWLTMLSRTGQRAEVIPKDSVSGRRTADAKLFNDYGGFLLAELKAPKSLLNPNHILNEDEAYKIVVKARKKKGSGANKQIGATPSMLVVGGLFLRNENIEALKNAAKANFRRVKSENIAVIQIVTFMIQVENGHIENGRLKIDPARTILRPQITHVSVINPNYSGYPPIEEQQPAEKTPAPSSQITIRGDGTRFNNVGVDF